MALWDIHVSGVTAPEINSIPDSRLVTFQWPCLFDKGTQADVTDTCEIFIPCKSAIQFIKLKEGFLAKFTSLSLFKN